MSAGEWRVGRFVAGAGAGEHVVVAHGSVIDRELEHPVEDHPAATRVAPVEAEHELIEVAGQMGGVDRTLVSAQQPPLDQRRDAVDRWQQLTGSSPRAAAARWLRRSRS